VCPPPEFVSVERGSMESKRFRTVERKRGAVWQAFIERRKLAAARGRKQGRVDAQQAPHQQRIIFGRHQAGFRIQQCGLGAAFVDREIVDHGSMAKGSARCSLRLVSLMMAWSRSCACALRAGSTMKPMPPPDCHPASRNPETRCPVRRAPVQSASPYKARPYKGGAICWTVPTSNRRKSESFM
jgi:hypothetical protein